MQGSIKKSGRNIHLALTGETYDDMHTGTREVGMQQQALQAQTLAIFKVYVQADPGNNANVAVGRQQGCYVQLQAGIGIWIPINDLNKVHVRAIAGTQTVNWIAMR